MKELKPYSREVFYYETDQMKIVHHSNYVRWFEEARIDFLKQIGMSYDEMENRGLLLPVLGVSCEYHLSFKYGDTFEVVPTVEKFNGLRIEISYKVYHGKTKKLHTTGTSSHCFTDRNLTPVRMKREYPDIYEKLVQYVQKD